MPKEYECLYCGGKFQDRPSKQRKYCSPKCRDAGRNILSGIEIHRVCKQCGEGFVQTKVGIQKYCSKTCQQQFFGDMMKAFRKTKD